jgi:REP element-mobilizing transposase RayT
MQPKYDYRRRLPHLQKDDHPLFVTFATKNRWKLPVAARDVVLDCCLKQNGSQFNLHAAVVMPDHVHLIYSPLRRDDGWSYSLPEIMKAIKGSAAWRINHMLNRSGPVWQEEFFDHVLRSNESLMGKVDYICGNPVRAGLVKSEGEYRWLWKGKIPVL